MILCDLLNIVSCITEVKILEPQEYELHPSHTVMNGKLEKYVRLSERDASIYSEIYTKEKLEELYDREISRITVERKLPNEEAFLSIYLN